MTTSTTGGTRWTWWAPLSVVVAAAFTELLVWTVLRNADPEGPRLTVVAIPLLVVAYAAFAAGVRGGLVGGVIVLAYGFYFFVIHAAAPGVPFFGGEFFRRATVLGVVALSIGGAVGALKDRDARREERAHRALAAKNRELERANEELQRANRALEAFTYVVSHDLKEPARALLAYSRELNEEHGDAIPGEARAVVQRTQEASERLTTLLEGLLDYARATRFSADQLDSLRLDEVLALPECAARYASALEEKGASLTVVPGPRFRAARGPICVALGNVILNSLRHHPGKDVKITIVSRPHDDDPSKVALVIEDSGPGFPSGVIEQYRAGAKTLGRGFGLLIAREAVEKMGGSISLGVASQGGARVVITLPGTT